MILVAFQKKQLFKDAQLFLERRCVSTNLLRICVYLFLLAGLGLLVIYLQTWNHFRLMISIKQTRFGMILMVSFKPL